MLRAKFKETATHPLAAPEYVGTEEWGEVISVSVVVDENNQEANVYGILFYVYGAQASGIYEDQLDVEEVEPEQRR